MTAAPKFPQGTLKGALTTKTGSTEQKPSAVQRVVRNRLKQATPKLTGETGAKATLGREQKTFGPRIQSIIGNSR